MDTPIDLMSKDPEMLKARIVTAKMSLISEIGDTFSWFCSIINKLIAIEATIREKPPTTYENIEQKLIGEYFHDGNATCPTCKQKPCKCVFYSVVC